MEDLFKASVSVPQTTLVRELRDGESVLLSMASERYFALDRVGTEMWNALTSAGSIEEGFRRLLPKYEVAEDRIRADFQEFVQKLASQGLIEINAGGKKAI